MWKGDKRVETGKVDKESISPVSGEWAIVIKMAKAVREGT